MKTPHQQLARTIKLIQLDIIDPENILIEKPVLIVIDKPELIEIDKLDNLSTLLQHQSI